MNYDKRIRDYHDIKCFASRNNRECLGKFGYFADDISEFENLDKCAMGICCFKDGEDFPFYRIDHTTRRPVHPERAYPIFIPADEVDITLTEKITVNGILGLFSENGKIESPLFVYDCDEPDTCYHPNSPTDYSGIELGNKKVKRCYYDNSSGTIVIETTN